MMTQTSLNLITQELVPEDRRLATTERLFGIHFPLHMEPTVFGITEKMAKSYTGGYWDFFTLSSGGFYMAPSEDRVFHVTCDNMFEGAFGSTRSKPNGPRSSSSTNTSTTLTGLSSAM